MTNQINILYVETGVSGGGSFESLFQLLKNLDREKFKPLVVFLSENDYVGKIRDSEIEVLTLFDPLLSKDSPKWKVLILAGIRKMIHTYFPRLSIACEKYIHMGLIGKLKTIIRERQIGIVHLNNQIGRHFFGVFLKSNDVIIISHLRSHHLDLFNYRMAQLANQKIDRFIAYFDDIANTWVKAGLDLIKLSIIHNGIEFINTQTVSIKEKLNLHKSTILIGAIGKDIPERDYLTLAKSLRYLLDIQNLRVVFMGEGDFRDVKEYLHQKNMQDRVIFYGKSNNCISEMKDLFCIVMPYTICPFGRVLLEAWMSSVPVIASNVSPIQKIFSDSAHGLLFEPRNAEHLAQKIRLLVENSTLRLNIIDTALKYCRENFNIGRHVSQIENLYCKETSALSQSR